MRLGTLTTLRELLAGRDSTGKLLISEKYACGLKRAAGLNGTKLFDVDAVIKWRKENPSFKITDIYPHRQPLKRQKSGRPAATAGKCGGRS